MFNIVIKYVFKFRQVFNLYSSLIWVNYLIFYESTYTLLGHVWDYSTEVFVHRRIVHSTGRLNEQNFRVIGLPHPALPHPLITSNVQSTHQEHYTRRSIRPISQKKFCRSQDHKIRQSSHHRDSVGDDHGGYHSEWEDLSKSDHEMGRLQDFGDAEFESLDGCDDEKSLKEKKENQSQMISRVYRDLLMRFRAS